jgi:outer membrane protein assembly factor BamA
MRILSRALTTLLILVALPAVAQDTIDKVVFHNGAPYTDAELLSASGLQPGQPLASDSLVIAAHQLLDTGLFDDAQITFVGQTNARTVSVELKPIPLDKLLPISLQNLAWFTPAELADSLHTRVPLYHGVASDAGNFPDILQTALQQMLTEKGITATLSHSVIEPTNLHPVRVINFRVDQPQMHLATVHLSFSGPPGSAATLTPGFQQAVNKATRIPFNEGLAGVTLEDLLLTPARDAGYINARLDNIQRTVAPSDKGLAVTYTTRIIAGEPYKLSAITCEPTPLYSAADFTRDNSLHPSDIANASALAKIEHAIEVAYRAHGYLDAYLLPSPTPDDTAHTVSYALRTVPGDVYHFKSVTPLNLSPVAQKEFDAGWLMKSGDVYNESYITDFIHANTALLHLATYTASFQSSADPQTHLVDLTINFIAGSTAR